MTTAVCSLCHRVAKADDDVFMDISRSSDGKWYQTLDEVSAKDQTSMVVCQACLKLNLEELCSEIIIARRIVRPLV